MQRNFLFKQLFVYSFVATSSLSMAQFPSPRVTADVRSKPVILINDKGILSSPGSMAASGNPFPKSSFMNYENERNEYLAGKYKYAMVPDTFDLAAIEALFGKGSWEVPTQQFVGFRSYNQEQDDQDIGSETKWDVMLETHYYAWNRIGVGLEVNFDRTSSKNGVEQSDGKFMTYGHVTYGVPLKGWGMYLRVGAGIGSEKQEYSSGSSSQEVKADLSGLKFEVGAPIHVYRSLFINPYVNYGTMTYKYDDGEEKQNTLRIGVGMVSYLNCGDGYDDLDSMGPSYINRYAQGVSFLGIHARTSYSSGNTELKFGSSTIEEDFNRFNFKVDYTYQIFQNFGLGAEVGYRSMTEKGNSSENTNSYLTFLPKVTYNFPTNNWLNDGFLQFGGGIGTRKIENTFSGNTNEQKDKISMFNAGLGYNWFVSKSSMFTFSLGYDWITEKDADNTDDKLKEKGVSFSVGFRTAFRIQRDY